MKLILLPVLIVFSCLVAGLYSVLHNQISYSVSPEYFHEFKFIQFEIEPVHHNRIGAGIVGFAASWWMGILIGLPIYLAAVFVKGSQRFIHIFLKTTIIVVIVTLLSGGAALIISYFTIGPPGTLPLWMANKEVTNPYAFARAGTMHNFSYLGGGIGLLIGLGYTIWQVRKSYSRITEDVSLL